MGIDTGVKVGDLMTRNFVHTTPNTDLQKCARMMVKKRVGSLVICENKILEGILTEKDIVWAVVKKPNEDLSKILAKDLMKRKVVTINPSKDVTEALDRMKKKKIRRLPVVENKKVIGMLTTKDIFKIDPGLFELISENAKIKEESEKMKRINLPRKEGVCSECGDYDLLIKVDNEWICEGCFNR